jgi:DNA-directed RNA polymerase specialized sigma24 family protein
MGVKGTNYLSEPIRWSRSSDAEYPYESLYDGRKLTLRVNDFPDEQFYTLLVDGNEHTSFDDWPDTWVHNDGSESQVIDAAIYLQEILGNLTDSEQKLLFLMWVEEMSIEDIAQALATDVKVVRYEIDKVRARLRARSRMFRNSGTQHLASEKVGSDSP